MSGEVILAGRGLVFDASADKYVHGLVTSEKFWLAL